MIFVTFISIHFVIICDVLLWSTYETHRALSLKSRCDRPSLVGWLKARKKARPKHDMTRNYASGRAWVEVAPIGGPEHALTEARNSPFTRTKMAIFIWSSVSNHRNHPLQFS
jgi:hypothetical protein